MYMSIYPKMGPDLELPSGPWRWTDDTHMALSIVETLKIHDRIDQDALAQAFARRFTEQSYRGYAGGAVRLLSQLADGADWREHSPKLFGMGSYGNGAAMRAAPIGGYFYGDPVRAAYEARQSAVITHYHPEGQSGAMAVAVAASIAASGTSPPGPGFLEEVLPHIPDSITKSKVEQAVEIPQENFFDAVRELGTGFNVSAQDTVPYCLWVETRGLSSPR